MLELRKPNGDRYIIHDNGDIERTDIPGFKPSGQWKMLGLVGIGRKRYVPLERITREWLAENALRFKNGKPRWTVRDLDHGTMREWGNTDHHGVASIRVIETEKQS